MEAELVGRAGLPYTSVPAAGVHGVGLMNLPGNLLQIARGYRAARRVVDQFDPQVMFFTGGFVAIPTALAGRQVPTVVFVPDIEPGLALKVVSRFADQIAVTSQATGRFFSKNAPLVETGYPARADLQHWDAEAAYRHFELSPDRRTLLVFGGSKGARSINRAVAQVLPQLLEEMQVVHVCGEHTWPEFEGLRDELPENLAAGYRAYPYLHDPMGAAFTIADLVVSRAGAATLGEFPQFGLPAVLVPYPFAWRYQKVNADHLATRGAALVVRDEELPEKLLPTVQALMLDEARREAMAAAMRALARPQAAESVADLLVGAAAHERQRLS